MNQAPLSLRLYLWYHLPRLRASLVPYHVDAEVTDQSLMTRRMLSMSLLWLAWKVREWLGYEEPMVAKRQQESIEAWRL